METLQKAHECIAWMYEGYEYLPEGREKSPCEFDETLTEASKRFVYGVYRALEGSACYEHPDQWQSNDAARWVAEGLADAASFLPETHPWLVVHQGRMQG